MKPKKRFGVWTQNEYLAKVEDNAKLYRKIGQIARYRLKCKLRANIGFILRGLRENEEYNRILGDIADDTWRTNYYHSPFSHLKKVCDRCKRRNKRSHP